MSKIVMYSGSTTGTTTTGDQYAFFINENGLPSIKKGSQVITFGTSGYAMQGSSGSSGANGTKGSSGSSGASGTSGQDGAPGSQGLAGTAGSSGVSGTAGINGIDGANGSSGTSGAGGTSGLSYGTSGVSGTSGASLAKVYEDVCMTGNASDYASFNPNGAVEGYFNANIISAGYGQTNLTMYQSSFLDESDVPSNSFGIQNIGAFSGKKITDVTLVRRPNSTQSVPAGTEVEYSSLQLIITKSTFNGESNTYTTSTLQTIDLSADFDVSYSGVGRTRVLSLSSYNIQADYNQGLTFYIKAVLESPLSSGKWCNIAAFDMYFSSVASGILGSNGTAGSSGRSGTNGVSGSSGSSGAAGATGSSGSSGATGTSGTAGPAGTSGTSAGGGGGVVEDTQYSFYVGPSAGQPTLTANRHQWHSVYGDGLQLDQGNGGGYIDQEYGFILPITLHAGETLDTLGVYVNETATSGTAEMKLMIMDKHPEAFLPNNILQTNTLTWTLEGIGNKWVSWDMDFTNTGSTNQTFFVWQLFSSKSTNPYDICRTVIYPPYLTYDYRQVGGYLYDNRFDKTGHWMTQGTSVYNSIPANFLTIMSSGQFTYTNDRGGHFYYQTSRP